MLFLCPFILPGSPASAVQALHLRHTCASLTRTKISAKIGDHSRKPRRTYETSLHFARDPRNKCGASLCIDSLVFFTCRWGIREVCGRGRPACTSSSHMLPSPLHHSGIFITYYKFNFINVSCLLIPDFTVFQSIEFFHSHNNCVNLFLFSESVFNYRS